jgi:hypothetical protein
MFNLGIFDDSLLVVEDFTQFGQLLRIFEFSVVYKYLQFFDNGILLVGGKFQLCLQLLHPVSSLLLLSLSYFEFSQKLIVFLLIYDQIVRGCEFF